MLLCLLMFNHICFTLLQICTFFSAMYSITIYSLSVTLLAFVTLAPPLFKMATRKHASIILSNKQPMPYGTNSLTIPSLSIIASSNDLVSGKSLSGDLVITWILSCNKEVTSTVHKHCDIYKWYVCIYYAMQWYNKHSANTFSGSPTTNRVEWVNLDDEVRGEDINGCHIVANQWWVYLPGVNTG